MDETRPFRRLRRIGLLILGLFVGVPLLVTAVTSVTPLADVREAFAWWPRAIPLARSGDRGTKAFGLLLISTQATPGLLLLLPLFLIFAQVQRLTGVELIGSYPGLVLIDLTFALPLAIWILTVHFAALPRDVEDAARMDGAGMLNLLMRVVVPIAAPGIAAAGVFTFIVAWSEVLFATIMTDEQSRHFRSACTVTPPSRPSTGTN